MSLRRPFVDLDGAVVVITGASSGIGRATADLLVERGATPLMAARSAEVLDEMVRDYAEQGVTAMAFPVDVSDPESVSSLAEAATETFGRIDAWINDAGVMAYGTMDETPIESSRRVIETNLLGTMYGAAEALRRFRAQGRGVLVNLASLYGVMTSPLVGAYVSSKFGVVGLSRVLRHEVRSDPGIAVSCVLPASIDTPIFSNAANYHHRRIRAIPPVASPHRVAAAIVRSIEDPRKEVRIGWTGRVLALAERLTRPLYDRVVGQAFRTIGFGRDDLPDVDDGNLFRPDPGHHSVEGGWRRVDVRRRINAWTTSTVRSAAGPCPEVRRRERSPGRLRPTSRRSPHQDR